jgi:hypothetical protein
LVLKELSWEGMKDFALGKLEKGAFLKEKSKKVFGQYSEKQQVEHKEEFKAILSKSPEKGWDTKISLRSPLAKNSREKRFGSSRFPKKESFFRKNSFGRRLSFEEIGKLKILQKKLNTLDSFVWVSRSIKIFRFSQKNEKFCVCFY